MGSTVSSPFSTSSKSYLVGSTMRMSEIVSAIHPDSKEPRPPTEVNVVVTGFGVWGDNVPWPSPPFNPSWLIANALPRVIFRHNKPNIRIITYPEPISGTWTGVRKLIPRIWDGKKSLFGVPVDDKRPGDDTFDIHAVLHCGCLDQPGEAFRLERSSFKSGYILPDNDGKVPSEDDRTGGGDWVKFPDKLSTEIDVDKVLSSVRDKVTERQVVASDDPNRYTCAWIYWVSLAELYKRHETPRVLFMHTPVEAQSEDVEIGVKMASAVLQGIVEDMEDR